MTRVPLPGLITYSPENPSEFHISLDPASASRLWPEPLGPSPCLACIHQSAGWVFHLLDQKFESIVYWTDIPDPTNALIAQMIPELLGSRLDPGIIAFVSSMHDQVHDVRRPYFETDAGPMTLHSWRVDPKTKRTLLVLEVVERHLLLQVFWQDNSIDLSAVVEIPELPSFGVAPLVKPILPPAIDAGTFCAHAGVAIYSFPLARLRACLAEHSEVAASVHPGRYSWKIKRRENIDFECLEILLAARHERTHFVQSMSTPYGVLQWRTLQAIVSTAGLLLRKITDSDVIARTVYLPVVDWYTEAGSDAVRRNPPFGPDTKRVLKNTGMDRRQYLADLPGRLDLYFGELSTLVRFWAAIGRREPLSMRSFEDLANEAFAILAINSDLSDYPRWRARDSNLESYLPEGAPTLEQIFEGDARLVEHQALAALGCTPAVWEGWRSRSVAGTYAPAYEWLLRELGSADVARVAIEIALTTPIDLISGDCVKDGLIHVEDCLPSWRLQKIVAVLKDFPWPRDRELAERAARREIAQKAGIPTPGQALLAMHGRSFMGPRGFGADARLHGAPAGAMDYFEYSRRELTRGLEIRKRDFLAFSEPSEIEIFQPLLEFFTDTVLFNGAPGASPSLSLYTKAVLSVIANKLLLEIFIGKGHIEGLRQIEAGFLARLATDDIAPDSIGWPGLSKIAKSLLGPHIAKPVHW